MAKTTNSDTIPSLTGIRGVAALTVVLSHVAIWLNMAVVPGQWAVDVFFVLSGFVMSLTYLRVQPVKWRDFAVARFARIYPLHIATAVLLGGYYLIKHDHLGYPAQALGPVHLLREITLTTAMPVVGDGLMWNDPSWSISIEAFVYILIFPPLVWLTARKVSPSLSAILISAALLVVGIAMMALSPHANVKTGWIAFGRGALGFAAGWAAYRLKDRLIVPAWLTDALCILLPILLVVTRLITGGRDAWFLLPLFPVVVLGLLNTKSVASRLLSTRPLVFLGDISYSIYLMHTLVHYGVTPLFRKAGLEHAAWAWFTIFPLIVIAVSAVTYRWFEKPARTGLRKLLDRRAKPEPHVAEVTF